MRLLGRIIVSGQARVLFALRSVFLGPVYTTAAHRDPRNRRMKPFMLSLVIKVTNAINLQHSVA